MDAEDWLARVEAGHPRGGFGHREHLRLAWLVLDRQPDVDAATERVSAAVRAIAVRHDRPQRYNRTVTDAWVRIVAHCRHATPGSSFDDMLADQPWLLDKRLLLRHYSSRVLASTRARQSSVPPDVHPIPA
jgi:hypothetical protein